MNGRVMTTSDEKKDNKITQEMDDGISNSDRLKVIE
jgi:hypothetical protein